MKFHVLLSNHIIQTINPLLCICHLKNLLYVLLYFSSKLSVYVTQHDINVKNHPIFIIKSNYKQLYMYWIYHYSLLFNWFSLQDEAIKTVKVAQKDTKIRTLTLEENGQTMELTLWRELSEKDLKIGQYIEVTHCLVSEWLRKKSLNSTRNTTIKVTIDCYIQLHIHVFKIQT